MSPAPPKPPPTAATAAVPTPQTELLLPLDDSYLPARRSNRVVDSEDSIMAKGDGERWSEKIAVCEGVTATGDPQLLLRSYFCKDNDNHGRRVWDEPPSGASQVTFATSEERKKTEAQMQELQQTLDMIPPDTDNDIADHLLNLTAAASTIDEAVAAPKKKKGLFGRFRGGGGASTSNKKDKQTTKNRPTVKESHDLNLQRAIARSMADQQRRSSSSDGMEEPVIYYDPNAPPPVFGGVRGGRGNDEEYDEELQLAKAISMSEAVAAEQHQHSITAVSGHEGEELLLKIALEESRILAEREQQQQAESRSAAGPVISTAARMPSQDSLTRDFLLSSIVHDNDATTAPSKQQADDGPTPTFVESSIMKNPPPPDDDDYWNQKMPAKPPAPSSPTTAVHSGPPQSAVVQGSPPSASLYVGDFSPAISQTGPSSPGLIQGGSPPSILQRSSQPAPSIPDTSVPPTLYVPSDGTNLQSSNPFETAPEISIPTKAAAPAFDPYGPTGASSYDADTTEWLQTTPALLSPPPPTMESLLIDLAPSNEFTAPPPAVGETLPSTSNDGTKNRTGRRLFGGKKALRDEAGVV